MNKYVASLIIRMDMALSDEGIGPKNGKKEDSNIINEAVKFVTDEFDDHTLWNYGYVSDKDHIPRCTSDYGH